MYLAVGNSDLGLIEYLRKEDAGLISTSLTGITEKLNLLINNSAIISEYAEKAYRCGENKHNKDMITNKLYCILPLRGGVILCISMYCICSLNVNSNAHLPHNYKLTA